MHLNKKRDRGFPLYGKAGWIFKIPQISCRFLSQSPVRMIRQIPNHFPVPVTIHPDSSIATLIIADMGFTAS